MRTAVRGLDRRARHFQRWERLPSVDGDSAVAMNEHDLARTKGCILGLSICQVHGVSNIMQKSLDVLDTIVGFLVNAVLAIGYGSTMEILRGILWDWLPDILEYRREVPPPEYRERLERLLRVFRPGDSHPSKLRRLLLRRP